MKEGDSKYNIKLDQLMFNRQFQQASQLLDSNPLVSQSDIVTITFIKQKIRIYYQIKQDQKLSSKAFQRLYKQIQAVGSDLKRYTQQVRIQRLILKLFACQFIPKVPQSIQSQINKQLKSLPLFSSLTQLQGYRNINKYFYLGVSILQLYIQKIISRDASSTFLQQIQSLLMWHSQLMRILEASSRYIESAQMMKKLMYIMIHRIISFYNLSLKVSYQEVLKFYMFLFKPQYTKLIEGKLEIALLYNIIKIGVLQQKIDLFPIFRYYERQLSGNNPQQHIIGVFCILNSLIVKRSQQTLLSNGMQRSQFKNKLWNSLYIYCNINFTYIVHKLDTIVKSIISYRVSSLLSVISSRFNIRNLTRFFIEKMYDSPFNHDIQTIKLCIEMFNASEFIKIDQLAKLVVSSINSSKLVEREVLIAMCSIFKGVILENREIGLAYAKLNHQEYLKNIQGRILLEETLLAHIGFAYSNLAKNQIYVESKMSFNAKALENFSRSFDLNRENYLVSYSLAKLYLENYDYENALKFSVTACKNNKDNWQPFALLACVYMCQKKMHKAEMIVSQLLLRYQKSPNLYYIKAFCEVNKLLTDVNNNEQVQASKFLGPQYYQSYKEKVLRSKDIKQILSLLQNSFRLLGFISDPAFSQSFLSKVKLPEQSDEIVEQAYYKSLKYAFQLLYAIDQVILCEVIVKKLSSQNNDVEKDVRYYKGLVHEKKKQNNLAYQEYRLLSQQSPYHCGALIRLALLEQDTNKANQYIELVSKFRDNEDYNFAKGVLLSRQQQYQAAHSYFLKQTRTCWVDVLPDFMYYY